LQQGIAPDMLIVDRRPSPCHCVVPEKKGELAVVCEFCVQANLIAWERMESKGNKPRPGRLVNTLKKLKKERVSEALGASRQTVHKILKTQRIPPKYAQRFYRNYEKGIPG
jgi:hypothetical protein